MAYTTLINDIQAVIKNNGNQEITGQVLQTALVEMVNELGSGYTYKGVATLSTTPDVTTPNIFYLLGAVGTYTNIGSIQHTSGIGIALWNGSAWSYQNVPSSAIIDIDASEIDQLLHTEFKQYAGWMSNGTGAYGAPPNTTFIVIPIVGGATYKFIRSASNNAHLAFLDSFNYATVVSNGFDIDGTRFVLTNATPVEGIVPANAKYIYVLRKYYNGLWVLPTIEINGVDITKALDLEILDLAGDVVANTTAISGKQDTLVSGTNIKTINSTSLLGSGDITIDADTETDLNLEMLVNGKFSDFVWTSGAFLHKNNGNPSANTGYKYTADYYKIKGGSYYYQGSSSGNAVSMAFYNASKTYLNEYVQGGIGTYTIPNDAVYVRFSTTTNISNNYISTSLNVASLDTRVTTLESQSGSVLSAIRLYPNSTLPVISFTFDDCTDNDSQVATLFESKGIRCGFAFIASDANITNKAQTYLGYQAKGHCILSHSIDSAIFNTTNYTLDTARAALYQSKYKLEKAGMIVNGFVAPSSSFVADFITPLRDNYAYAYSYMEYPNDNNRDANPCNLTRKSMEATTTANLKTFIDTAITQNHCINLYGHPANFGTTPSVGEEWNLAKLEEIIDYALTKQANGSCWVGSPDMAIKYFYELG